MTKEEAINKGLELINRSTFAMLGSNGDEGYPNIKAMFKMDSVLRFTTEKGNYYHGLENITFEL